MNNQVAVAVPGTQELFYRGGSGPMTRDPEGAAVPERDADGVTISRFAGIRHRDLKAQVTLDADGVVRVCDVIEVRLGEEHCSRVGVARIDIRVHRE